MKIVKNFEVYFVSLILQPRSEQLGQTVVRPLAWWLESENLKSSDYRLTEIINQIKPVS